MSWRDSLDGMKSRPSLATLTAAGPRKPVARVCALQPTWMLELESNESDRMVALPKIISINSAYNSRSLVMRRVEYMLNEALDTLSGEQAELFSTLPNGYKDLNELRSRLSRIPHTLKKYKPEYNYKFTSFLHQYETDWQ